MSRPTKKKKNTGSAGDSELEGERIVQIRVDSRPERLRLVRAVVGEAASLCGCSENCVRDIVIAVDEACQNVIRHAYGGNADGEILIDIRRDGDLIAFNIIDFADPVDVSKIKPRSLEELRPGGLGIHFISQCMDDARFRSPPNGAGNRLWMVKRIE
ncbi:MAG: ATP-binding protein [Gammaproteobacteria bacterium]|nr:ATP-binding protein [Gammaproteobacteria bacterium]MDH3413211.1 ATP-binding protein [Gammaproteobacteria bacterium]